MTKPGHEQILYELTGTIDGYIAGQPVPKRTELKILHTSIMHALPESRLWFLDGKDNTGKTVSNPNIGYGFQARIYSDGSQKELYQIGLSANTSGISVYIIGIQDKSYLAQTYGRELGRATITGYCIRFKRLKDINIDVLIAAILDGVKQTT